MVAAFTVGGRLVGYMVVWVAVYVDEGTNLRIKVKGKDILIKQRKKGGVFFSYE